MENVHSIFRSIISRRLWLFSGLLALLLGLLSLLLLPTFLAHAASAQKCQMTTARTGGAYGVESTGPVVVHGRTASQGCTIRTGGKITSDQGGTCTAKVVEGQVTTVTCTGGGTCTTKGAKGQKTTVACVASRKHP